MWTAKNRGRYDRSKLRYPSDLTDGEWGLVEPLIPPARRGGNRRHVDVREVMNGIMYILSTGCQWRAIPKDLPPRSTVHDYLDLWSYDGTLDRIHHALYMECREHGERDASPTAAIIDSQSVKSAEKGGLVSIRMAMMQARRSKARSASAPKLHFYHQQAVEVKLNVSSSRVLKLHNISKRVAGNCEPLAILRAFGLATAEFEKLTSYCNRYIANLQKALIQQICVMLRSICRS